MHQDGILRYREQGRNTWFSVVGTAALDPASLPAAGTDVSGSTRLAPRTSIGF